MRYGTLLIVLLPFCATAQNVGINATGAAPAAPAMLDVDATDRGVLIPRVSLTAANNNAPIGGGIVESLLVYNTNTAGAGINAVTPGYYYWDGTRWQRVATGRAGWELEGNLGTNPANNFVGTGDNQALRFRTNNLERFEITTGTVTTGGHLRAFNPGVIGNATTGVGATPTYSFIDQPGAGMQLHNPGGVHALTFTSGSNSIRMRIYSGGHVVVNRNVNLWGEDLFSAYGVNGTMRSAVNGYAGNGVVVSGVLNHGVGVYGQGTATAHGVQGLTAAPGTNGFGGFFGNQNATGTGVVAYGLAAGDIWVAAGSGVSATGNNVGVAAYGEAAASYGLRAAGNNLDGGPAPPATGGGGYLVGNPLGAYGRAQTVASGIGILGTGNNTAAFTLTTGAGGAFRGTNIGAFGHATTAATGTGVVGVGNNVAVATAANLTAVLWGNGSGGAFSGTTLGSYNRATAAGGWGMLAVGPDLGGFGAAGAAVDGTGLAGVGNNLNLVWTLVQGSGLAGTGSRFGVYGVGNGAFTAAAGTIARAGGYFVSGPTLAGPPPSVAIDVYAYVAAVDNLPRKIEGIGTVNTIVDDGHGNKVLLSAPEAPENLFQDFGTGQLVNGRAHIELDPIFSHNILVNEEHPLRVFVQLRGNCNGVYVENETATGFDVVELMDGASNAKFFWTVTGNRANVVSEYGREWNYAEERFGAASLPAPAQPRTLDPQRDGVPTIELRMEDAELMEADEMHQQKLKPGQLGKDPRKWQEEVDSQDPSPTSEPEAAPRP